MSLTTFLLKRAFTTLITVWVAATVAFLALHVLPGDAVEGQLARSGASLQQIATRRAELGLDQPLLSQYAALLAGLSRGDLGRSLSTGRPVSEIIREQFGATAALATGALLVAIALGLGLGLLISAPGQSGTLGGRAAGALSIVALSAPIYWTGTLAIYFFSVWLRVLPSAGSGDLAHLILPAMVLGFSVAGGIARVTAAATGQAQGADYVRTARAKGLREGTITRRHVLRASLTPILAVIALQVGFLLGGTVITEIMFVRPGIGKILLTAVNEQDYPVVLGVVVLSAVIFSVAGLAADLLSAAANPRLREGGPS